MSPVTMNQRGCPSARIASAVCIACSIWERSMSGSESSTIASRSSVASQMVIFLRERERYSRFFPRTKSSVWWR